MSVRCLLLSAAVVCLAPAAVLVLPVAASAAGIYIPSPLPDDTAPRPTYRERMKAFPPPGGRFGGGPLEYFQTGGRPVPVAPQYADSVLPNFVNRPYAQPGDRPADYGGVGSSPPQTEYFYADRAYPVATYGASVYAEPHPARASLPRGGIAPFRRRRSARLLRSAY